MKQPIDTDNIKHASRASVSGAFATNPKGQNQSRRKKYKKDGKEEQRRKKKKCADSLCVRVRKSEKKENKVKSLYVLAAAFITLSNKQDNKCEAKMEISLSGWLSRPAVAFWPRAWVNCQRHLIMN